MTGPVFTLDDCEIEEGIGPYGVGMRWTHESGAYVELIHDDDPTHPLDNGTGIAIAFREGDRYSGTAPDYPRYPSVECSACEGSGECFDRFELCAGYYGPIVGAGTEAAMHALRPLFPGPDTRLIATTCPVCKGEGAIDCDTETYFRVTRDAQASYEFDTGNHGEATAVIYTTDDDWTDPAGAVKAWADEYQSWAEGDVWGIEVGGPGVEKDSVWGFIGREHTESAALSEFLIPAIDASEKEHAEAAYWLARDVETVEVSS